MSFNYLMLETLPAKELSVAEEVDRLVGMDSSYCPLWHDLKDISRKARWRGRAVKSSPIIPRLIFVTSSFPDLAAILAVHGADKFILNPWEQPEVVPGWEMDLFKVEVEKRRLWCLKMAASGIRKDKTPKFRSFADLKAWFASNNTGETLSDDGEILAA